MTQSTYAFVRRDAMDLQQQQALRSALVTLSDVAAAMTCQPRFRSGGERLSAAGRELDQLLQQINSRIDALPKDPSDDR